jgi:hypothetical protein
MVKVVIKETGKSFNLDPNFKQNLDVALHAVKNHNQDLCIVFDGHEGAGKSQSSRQIGYYCSLVLGSKFDVDSTYNIHHNLDSYVDACNNNGRFYISILDESRSAVNSKRSNSNDSLRFTNFLSECRSNNQVHILILPSYSDLDHYISMHRMSLLINMRKVWVLDSSVELGGHRLVLGNYRGFANDVRLKMLMDKRKKFIYPRKPEFDGCFDNVEVLSDTGLVAYEEQKRLNMVAKYGIEAEKNALNAVSADEEFVASVQGVYNLSDRAVLGFKRALFKRFCFFSSPFYDYGTNRLNVSIDFLCDFF